MGKVLNSSLKFEMFVFDQILRKKKKKRVLKPQKHDCVFLVSLRGSEQDPES